ncbi:hypothetical protein DASC09_054920 [Saccharomycopsis crataegensis]|uniref:Uncharacterized protein n=1 Tax=Saccharomycopsis crataegensis TaxID=43959 RepID=A0AAV5QTI3_9ASCO|nr:hypothetical protein DASC09_054920 [Saccharomycopsis crataegensis]
MSTPNLPHTENLTPLYDLVVQVHQLAQEQALIQSSITTSIDTLSIKLDHDNNTTATKTIKLNQIKSKNAELMSRLESTTGYIKTVVNLLNHYEVSIQTIMNATREDVIDYNLGLLSTHREMYDVIQRKSQEEYQQYAKLVAKRTIIHAVSEKIRKMLATIEELGVTEDVETSYKLGSLKQILIELTEKKTGLQQKKKNDGDS